MKNGKKLLFAGAIALAAFVAAGCTLAPNTVLVDADSKKPLVGVKIGFWPKVTEVAGKKEETDTSADDPLFTVLTDAEGRFYWSKDMVFDILGVPGWKERHFDYVPVYSPVWTGVTVFEVSPVPDDKITERLQKIRRVLSRIRGLPTSREREEKFEAAEAYFLYREYDAAGRFYRELAAEASMHSPVWFRAFFGLVRVAAAKAALGDRRIVQQVCYQIRQVMLVMPDAEMRKRNVVDGFKKSCALLGMDYEKTRKEIADKRRKRGAN